MLQEAAIQAPGPELLAAASELHSKIEQWVQLACGDGAVDSILQHLGCAAHQSLEPPPSLSQFLDAFGLYWCPCSTMHAAHPCSRTTQSLLAAPFASFSAALRLRLNRRLLLLHRLSSFSTSNFAPVPR